PSFLRDLVSRLAAEQYRRPFVANRDEENEHAQNEAELRDPYRNLDEPLSDFVESPALPDELRDGPQHVRHKQKCYRECAEFGSAAPAPLQPVDPEAHAHELAMAKRMTEREECGGRSEPGR